MPMTEYQTVDPALWTNSSSHLEVRRTRRGKLMTQLHLLKNFHRHLRKCWKTKAIRSCVKSKLNRELGLQLTVNVSVRLLGGSVHRPIAVFNQRVATHLSTV